MEESRSAESQLPLFVGAGVGAFLVVAIIVAIIIIKKRKNEQNDEESGSQLKKFGESKTALLGGKETFDGHIVNGEFYKSSFFM